MTAFDTVMAEVFTYSDDAATQGWKLSLEDERAAITAAKAGDQEATLTLIRAYGPTLRRATGQYRYAGGVWATGPHREHSNADLHMSAIEGLLEAIQEFNPEIHNRLASIVGEVVTRTVSEALVGPIALSVPGRTLRRFYGILRDAGGDPEEGARIAPAYEMKRETFLAVLEAVRATDTLDAPVGDEEDPENGWDRVNLEPLWDGQYADAEDRILVEAAFAAVDTLEKDVTSLAYGFSDYDPVPDAEIGHRLGLSRQKAQRTRATALDKMRSALGVA